MRNKLLIIFFIVLGLYFYKLSTASKNIDENTDTNNTEVQNIRVNDLIINENDNSIYNIAINEPTELDFLTKQQVFDLRKKYANMSPAIIPANYAPSDTVFGQIEDNKPWWGLIGMMFGGPGQHSIDGLSEESRTINNPLLLFLVDPNFWFVDMKLNGAEIYPKPISITFYPSEKTIKVVYDVTDFNSKMNNFLITSASSSFSDGHNYTLVGSNARDFGYDFAYAYSLQNISFNQQGNNLSTDVQQLQDYLHTGGSCGYAGGCNNHSPTQRNLEFTEITLPSQIGIRLWKKQPLSKNSPADLYYIINFQ